MKRPSSLFIRRVYEIVSKIPKGKVTTYGFVALMVGIPRAAREVGWIAHNGPSNLPWQRVVNRNGGLAKGYPGGQLRHKMDLEKDGIVVRPDITVDLTKYLWCPSQEEMKSLELPPEIAAEVNAMIPFSQERLRH